MNTRKSLSKKTTDELLRSMLVLSRTVDHVLEKRAVEAAHQPLSRSKTNVLRILERRRNQTPTQVARFLGVTRPAVTQIVDSMVDSNLVRRLPVEQDRREWELKLTAKGRKLAEKIREEQRQVVRNSVRDLAGTDVREWIGFLQEICSSLAEADGAFDKFCTHCGAHTDGNCVLVGGNSDCLFLQTQRETTS